MNTVRASQSIFFFIQLSVFKQLDTRPKEARFCFHTSFDDPNAFAEAPGRRSIEARVLCAFRLPDRDREQYAPITHADAPKVSAPASSRL